MQIEGWEKTPLLHLLDKIIDYRGQSVPKSNQGIPLITARNVRDGYLDFSSEEFISEDDFDSWMTRGIPKAGDILFTTEAPLGKACRFPEEGKFAVGQRTVTLRTNEKLNSEYLLYFILSEFGQNLIELKSSGSTAKGIKSSELKKVEISYPINLIEQKKIAEILSTWDKAIETVEKLVANSQQQKKALMQQLLTGQKRLLDDNGVKFGGEWNFLKFDNVFKVANNKSTQIKNSDYLESGSIPIIDQGQSLIAGYCESSNTYTDIPVIIFGDHTRCVKWVDFDFCMGADGTQVLKVQSSIYPKFGFYILSFVDIPNLGYSRHMRELKEKEFKIPSLIHEQKKIAQVLTLADREIDLYQQQLDKLKLEKKSLMQQLLTGQKRVKID